VVRHSGRVRRGAVAVMVAAGMTVFMLFLGLVIDVGFWYVRRAQVQLNADLAVLAAMGAVDQTKPEHFQKTFVRNTALGIIAANGYAHSQWQMSLSTEVVGARTVVTTAVIETTQQLPRFFTSVVAGGTVPMFLQSRAEKKVLPDTSISCSIIALDDIELNGGGNGQISFIGNRNADQTIAGGSKVYDNANAHACANGDFSLGGNSGWFGRITTGGTVGKNGNGSYETAGNWLLGGTTSSAPNVGTVQQGQQIPTFTWNMPTTPANLTTTGNDNTTITGDCGQPDSSGDWRCSGNKTAFMPVGGTYYVKNLEFTGQANIVLTGVPGASPTDFWVTGDVRLEGGMSFNQATTGAGSSEGNLNGVQASDLRILGIGTQDTDSLHKIDIGGGSEIVADIMAPTYVVNFQGSSTNFFGRVVANDLVIGGGVKFSYDESIPNTTFTQPGASIRAHLID
jgi:Flp pilus assembly protein TadG